MYIPQSVLNHERNNHTMSLSHFLLSHQLLQQKGARVPRRACQLAHSRRLTTHGASPSPFQYHRGSTARCRRAVPSLVVQAVDAGLARPHLGAPDGVAAPRGVHGVAPHRLRAARVGAPARAPACPRHAAAAARLRAVGGRPHPRQHPLRHRLGAAGGQQRPATQRARYPLVPTPWPLRVVVASQQPAAHPRRTPGLRP